MKKYTKNIGYIVFIILFIGCNSLPKNITQKEYNSVRDFVSIKVSGLSYLVLYG